MLPIPKHLKSILIPTGTANNEFEVTGHIVCDFGNDHVSVHLLGNTAIYGEDKVVKVIEINGNYFLIIKINCNKCLKEHLVFDNDYHGWNGFVCGGDSRNIPKPPTIEFRCFNCSSSDHQMTVRINSQGQEDFIEEGEGEYDQNDWVEAFSWITIRLKCNMCSEKNEEWISYETM